MSTEIHEPGDGQAVVGAEEVQAPPTGVGFVSSRPIDLADLRSVRRELCRVYRDARSGRLGTADASRLTFMLHTIGRLLESELFEARLRDLERRASHAIP